MKQEPEEIPDTEHELVLERVCAIDVAKDSGKVCVRVSSRAGRRVSKVWDVAARSGAVAELAEQLVGRLFFQDFFVHADVQRLEETAVLRSHLGVLPLPAREAYRGV